MVPEMVKDFEDFKARTSNKEFLLNIGDSFVFNNESFTISGWKPRSRKYPLLAVSKNGRTFKFAGKFAFQSGKAPNFIF